MASQQGQLDRDHLSPLKRTLAKKNNCGYYDRASPEKLFFFSFLMYHSPMLEAWKVPKRPVEVSRDVTQHLVAYRTAVDTRTNSSGMRTHTRQQSRLACMHTLIFT